MLYEPIVQTSHMLYKPCVLMYEPNTLLYPFFVPGSSYWISIEAAF